MKNKNLILFIGVGFIVTIAIWGFVGGCGTTNMQTKKDIPKAGSIDQEKLNTKQRDKGLQTKREDNQSADGPIFEEDAAASQPSKIQAAIETPLSKGRVRQTYIVTQGDNLWNISKKFGVSVTTIKEANSLRVDSISTGQSLIIPGSDIPKETKGIKEPAPAKDIKVSNPTKTITDEPKQIKAPQETQQVKKGEETKLQPKPGAVVYTVRKNDNLWRIAQAYGTTAEHIADLNKFSKNAQLAPGQEILVPSE